MSSFPVGFELPPIQLPPLSRTTLALFCGASGDHNPVHVDTDFARAAGLDDVIAHGMLSMAWLSRMLTDWCPQARLRSFGVRFRDITQVGDAIHCRGSVVAAQPGDRPGELRILVEAINQDGQVTLAGEALVSGIAAAVRT